MADKPSYWEKTKESFGNNWPLWGAISITALFAVWIYSLASEVVSSASNVAVSRWQMFLAGEPNAMGDTLAGVVGSLTLVWVVASVIQQSMELRAQRKEFNEMVKAQEAQVEALEAQAELFRDEKRYRDELVAKDELEALMTSVGDQIVKITDGTRWGYLEQNSSGGGTKGLLRLFSTFQINQVSDDLLIAEFNQLSQISKQLHFHQANDNLTDKPVISESIVDMYGTLSRISEVNNKLSVSQRRRCERIGFHSAVRTLEGLMNTHDLWIQTS